MITKLSLSLQVNTHIRMIRTFLRSLQANSHARIITKLPHSLQVNTHIRIIRIFLQSLQVNVHVAMITCPHSLQVNGDVIMIRTFLPVPTVECPRQDDYNVSSVPPGKRLNRDNYSFSSVCTGKFRDSSLQEDRRLSGICVIKYYLLIILPFDAV